MKNNLTSGEVECNKASPSHENPPSIKSADYEILTKLRDGNPDAFKEMFRRWDKPLLHFLTNLTGSVHDAEDISQEAFINLWQYRHTIDPTKSIKTYIFLIGKQLAWKLVNRERRFDRVSTDEMPDVEGDASFDSILEAEEMEIIMKEIVKKMPRITRRVYELHYNENLTNEEIAQRLGIKPNAVRSRLSEARSMLKDVFTLYAFMFLLDFFSDTTIW